MKAWGLVALVPTLCAAAVAARALPGPTTTTNPTAQEYDPLWEIYGLNRSAEYKYFHEPGRDDILGHYDVRFFTEPVATEERTETLTHMVRAYLNFFTENDLETWIAHGTLLGWWWNGKILPWDWDIDTQVPDTTLARLGDDFNQTIVSYTSADKKVKRKYLLDINPWSRQRERGKGHNIIDARWIDIKTGLYIDITGLSRLNPETEPDIWQCKNFHKYKVQDIYPLRKTTFEGTAAMVPFLYDSILTDEYSLRSLTATNFHNHTWYPDLEEWILDDEESMTARRREQESQDGRYYE
ncbi:hypothetical protein ASPZODRAFT_128436 [Penicilliopsis zonata CBS 506.65]|uniref:LicD/FKTN/FKRP nucleotidyltransferase domain-containing protein n=1 Tax=Penicilliopsis zonata CBS 506.65 TaxID=1073090 RepID=A0A1L9SRP2_9EURO|nr:hypothetical protein ASPZODRAFT_128436 [Penicilliopsis zonata CBS 506.65]OJJ49879.1 hypothetical protein ASPZODRAFT_128436 [Penicilliopsis zonata CBS 506.65]